VFLGKKAFSFLGTWHSAGFFFTENAVSIASHQAIAKVSDGLGETPKQHRSDFPTPCETPKNADHSG